MAAASVRRQIVVETPVAFIAHPNPVVQQAVQRPAVR